MLRGDVRRRTTTRIERVVARTVGRVRGFRGEVSDGDDYGFVSVSSLESVESTVVLHRGRTGFGEAFGFVVFSV